MIFYEDLLGAPYERFGNCYGFIEECCRRAGTPIENPFTQLKQLPAGSEAPYIEQLNVREIPAPKAGAIAECLTGKNLHVAYMITDTLALHTTEKHGARITHIYALNPKKYYEVLNESNNN